MIELLVLLVLSTAFAVIVLIFDVEDRFGPFSIENTYVLDTSIPQAEGPINLFDFVRRLFGAYRVDNNVWTVYEPRMAVWRCATCLSFWMSLPASTLYVGVVYLETGDLRTLLAWPIVHGAVSMLTAFVARLYQIVVLIEYRLTTGE